MDRASDSGSEGWGFESLLAYQKTLSSNTTKVLLELSVFQKNKKGYSTPIKSCLVMADCYRRASSPGGLSTRRRFPCLFTQQRGKELLPAAYPDPYV